MTILQQSQRKIDKTSVSFAKKYTLFLKVDRSDEGRIEIWKIIQSEYKLVSKLCVSAMFHVLSNKWSESIIMIIAIVIHPISKIIGFSDLFLQNSSTMHKKK